MNTQWLGQISFVLGLVAAAGLLLLGPAYRWGWVTISFVFDKGFPAVVYLAGAAALCAVLTGIFWWRLRQGSSTLALLGLVFAIVSASVPLGIRWQAQRVPASRVGNSDLGVNAQRIREFRQRLLARVI